jgi:hypothetical protein
MRSELKRMKTQIGEASAKGITNRNKATEPYKRETEANKMCVQVARAMRSANDREVWIKTESRL